MKGRRMNRRDFLKIISVGVAALLLPWSKQKKGKEND